MPTSFVFNAYGWVNDNGSVDGDAGGPNIPTITASVDDGSIDVGDLVTLSGMAPDVYDEFAGSPFDWDGAMRYSGTGTFGGQTGYVFRLEPTARVPDGYFVVFYNSPTAVLNDLEAYFDDPSSQTLGTTALTCFLAGTEVATAEGPVRVEELEIGARLQCATGGWCTAKWIGRQTVSTRFGPAERLMPVRFAAGSLGEGLPHTDLTVTADHGMLVDGVICHAGALVNGTTITWVPLAEMGETYTVYHIETEEHEIILANGAPAETFIDNVSRRVFDNYAEFEALCGDVPEMEELPYPRAMSARQVPSKVKSRLSLSGAA